MIKSRKTKQIAAIFLIINFLNSLFPYNFIYAQSTGPNAPEAAAFEPVDATDMVNLLTGDYTYVLPLLNVPSPEGGYPIALSYHAGIAMDQESSWVGLGWNLNPGAINRSVNGLPDDYKYTEVTNDIWDSEQKITQYRASIGYSWGGGSVGLGFSWGSHKSLGGTISIGVGGLNTSVGENGASIGYGLKVTGVLSLGVDYHTEGGLSGSVGITDTNGNGFNISSNGSFGLSIGLKGSESSGSVTSLDMSFSSSGVGLSVSKTNYKGEKDVSGKIMNPSFANKIGTGLSVGFNKTIQQGDYSTSTSGWLIPLFIPTHVGVFSLSFGKSVYKFSLYKTDRRYVNGTLYFDDEFLSKKTWLVSCREEDYDGKVYDCGYLTTNDEQEALDYASSRENQSGEDCSCDVSVINSDQNYMDIYELPVLSGDYLNRSRVTQSNPNFPNYDKFNVQAQGLSGAITSKLFENGALFGASNKNLSYVVNSEKAIDNKFKFHKKPYFYFENEISTYLETPVADLDESVFLGSRTSSTNILSSLRSKIYNKRTSLSSQSENISRRKTSNYIEYFTNEDILSDDAKEKGFLKPVGKGFDRSSFPKSGIGGFKITAIDGKTYHYSLPVYNHEIIQRTFGNFKDSKTRAPRPENKAYYERRQMLPYATHWLLTAVTGGDYVDVNNDGYVNKGDYGYWISFEYGKYSSAFMWRNPSKKDYIENEDDKDTKTYVVGRKDLYYLNRMKTRTHSAIFIKSKRQDGASKPFTYKSRGAKRGENRNSYYQRFTIPSQYPLKLDKILLYKGNDKISEGTNSNSVLSTNIDYPGDGGKKAIAKYNLLGNIIDVDDISNIDNTNVIKSIDFDNNYYELSDNSLTLKNVVFKGRNGESAIPPYKFNYITSNYKYDIEDQDDFGFVEDRNELWSLNEVTTPTGAKIKIDYEKHKIKSVLKSNISSNQYKVEQLSDYRLKLKPDKKYGLKVGDSLDVTYSVFCDSYRGDDYDVYSEDDDCQIKSKFVVEQIDSNDNIVLYTSDIFDCRANGDYCRASYDFNFKVNNPIELGGVRVKRISIVDESNNYYSTNYSYGKQGDGIGYVTYLPYAPNLAKELPYSAELPPPKPMYEYVSTTTTDSDQVLYGLKTEYRFNILKEKNDGKAKFGNIYELKTRQTYGDSNSDIQLHSFTIKDNLNSIGKLLGVKTYNEQGQLLSNISNNYYQPGETPNKLGVVQESYQTYKKVTKNGSSKSFGVSSTRITYPSLLKSSTELRGGHSYTSEFNDLDSITGQAREVYSYSSDGLKFKTRSIQAYKKYPNMGSKVDSIGNKNMLSQVAGEVSYLYKDNLWRVIGANITTWNNDWIYRDYEGKLSRPTDDREKVFRKHKTYVWDGSLDNGVYTSFSGEDDNFVWGIGSTQTDSDWKEVSEITMYNRYSHPLEVKDINGNYASTKMTGGYYANERVLASCNSRYTEMYYSGAEEGTNNPFMYSGEVTKGYIDEGFGPSKSKSHTGYYSNYTSTSSGFKVDLKARDHRTGKYKISVWIDKGNEDKARVSINGSLKPFNGEKVSAGDWVMLTHYEDFEENVQYSVSILSSGGNFYADDFRLHPISSSMLSYVYSNWDEVSYIMGSNGLSTHYKYDEAGRLKEVWTEVVDAVGITGGFKLSTTNKYNYKK